MSTLRILFLWVLFSSTPLLAGMAQGDDIKVAVSSNFIGAMRAIVERFENKTADQVTLIFGATGKHYAQIHNGAPFDIFFAADSDRPQRLEKEGIAVHGSRFTYAYGKVVLWSPIAGYLESGADRLSTQSFRYLAVANPKLAPYGKAAFEVLDQLGLWATLSTKIVRGENIGQTYQFVQSGNAELGFIALSQIQRPGFAIEGSLWRVPEALYTPIEQQAVVIKDSPASQRFISFVKSDEAQEIIHGFGYSTP